MPNNFHSVVKNLTTATIEIAPKNLSRDSLFLFNRGPGIAYFFLADEPDAYIPIGVNRGCALPFESVPSNAIQARSESTSNLVVWDT